MKILNILLDEKSYENIFINGILCKTLIGAKPLLIMFDKVNWFIKVYDGTERLISFSIEKYNAIYDRIRYFIQLKNGIRFFLIIMQKSELIHVMICL